MKLNTYYLLDTELEHLANLLKENRQEEAREYLRSYYESYLENVIQAHLYGYWFIRIKYGQKEEKLLQIAEKRLEELKSISQSSTTFVIWEDFDKNIHHAIFGSYIDFQEWSQADYIFRILDVR